MKQSHAQAITPSTPSSTSTWRACPGSNIQGVPSGIIYGGQQYAFTWNKDITLGMYNVSSGAWMSLGGTLASSPMAAPASNGTLAVIARMQNGQIQVNYVQPFGGSSGFTTIGNGTPSGVSFTGNPVLAVNNNARLEAFSLSTNGQMYHTYQTTVSNPIQWSNWSLLGAPQGGFVTMAQSFTVFLQANSTGALQAVALGNDNLIYIATQYAGGGYDGWSSWSAILPEDPNQPQFGKAPAAAYSTATSAPVYVGYNSNSSGTNNLLFYTPVVPATSWTQPPNLPQSALSAPVLLSNLGTAQLTYLGSDLQVRLLSQTGQGGQGVQFWGSWQPVGTSNAAFTGLMSAIPDGTGGVVMFQSGNDFQLYYIDYTPGS